MMEVWETSPGIDTPKGPLVLIEGTFQVPAESIFAYRNIVLPEALRGAVPKRQIEFLAGRYCAARALDRLGFASTLLPIGERGAPLWPREVVGSISHSQGRVMCVAGLRPGYQGLGIDIEHIVAMDDATMLASDIAAKHEFALVTPFHDFRVAFTILFSAKEAIYKAIHERVRRVVEFNEVTCTHASATALRFELLPELAVEANLHKGVDVSVKTSEAYCVTLCSL